MGSLLAILLVYIIYYIFSVTRYDKSGHYKDKSRRKGKGLKKLSKEEIKALKKKDYDKLPNEVKFFVSKYKIDLDKVNIRGLLKMVGLVLGIDIAIATIIVVTIFKNDITIEIIVGFIIMLVLYLISLKIMGVYFEKKGLVKDE
jgi:hypothetical protein